MGVSELRLRLERFADRYTDGMAWELDRIATLTSDPVARRAAMDHALAYPTAAIMIASGPEPAVSLLDMLVFITLVRTSLEDHWIPEVYGPVRGASLLAKATALEAEGYAGARAVLATEDLEAIREGADRWRAENPSTQYVEGLRFGDLAAHIEGEQVAGSGMLEDLRRASRAADAALDLAERLMYLLQRAPFLWDRHAALAVYDITQQPELAKLIASSTTLSASAERMSLSVERLTDGLLVESAPEQRTLQSNLGRMDTIARGILDEAQETIEASNELVSRLTALAETLDLGGEQPGTRPFDILEYQAAAGELTGTVGELHTLVVALNELLASPTIERQIPAALVGAGIQGEAFIEYLLMLMAAAMLFTMAATVMAFLAYRYASRRLDERLARPHASDGAQN